MTCINTEELANKMFIICLKNDIKWRSRRMNNKIKLNKIYCMDNLKLLKQMADESVDLIYCDILYNTGKKFKDYDDKLGTPQEAMEWYRPRLVEMKRILKNTGSIYLQCDYRLVHYLKVEMDNIFGLNNFRNDIIWDKGFRGTERKTFYQYSHDNILFYTKSDNYIWNSIKTNYADRDMKRYNKIDDEGKMYALIKRKRTDGSVYYGKTYPNEKGKKADDVIRDIKTFSSTSKERVGYDTQKPKKLSELIIKASSNKNDVIGDFFCGSGTSLVVAKELGRRYIGCDINPRAVEITNKRLKNIS